MPTLSREAVRDRMKTKYDEVFDDDRDGVGDGKSVDLAVAHAVSWMVAKLNQKGFTADQLEKLCKDPIFIDAMAWKAADYGLAMKPEYVNEKGETSYSHNLKAATGIADDVADQIMRARSEAAAGAPSTTRAIRIDPDPPFHFAPTVDNPRGRTGGF